MIGIIPCSAWAERLFFANNKASIEWWGKYEYKYSGSVRIVTNGLQEIHEIPGENVTDLVETMTKKCKVVMPPESKQKGKYTGVYWSCKVSRRIIHLEVYSMNSQLLLMIDMRADKRPQWFDQMTLSD
jgi:hypothetical protein